MTDLPAGYVVTVGDGDRVHFQDWGGPVGDPDGGPVGGPRVGAGVGVLLVHGLSQTSWIWAPVARRLARHVRTVAMDLRGHGLSDAPTENGAYVPGVLAEDVEAAAEGSGLLDGPAERVVLAGHGFGAIVAASAAVRLGVRCAGLVLVDGGWEWLETATGMDVDEFLRAMDEPPEVMASLRAFLRDRRGFDPATWDDDQERAARATVVETHAGRVVPATRPHALEASVRSMFGYDPRVTLGSVAGGVPIVALVAADDADGSRGAALATVSAAREAVGRTTVGIVPLGPAGHNLMRYRPADVTAAILSLVAPRDDQPTPR